MCWTATAMAHVEDGGESHDLIDNGEGESEEQALAEAIVRVMMRIIFTYDSHKLLNGEIKWTVRANAVKRLC